MRYGRSGLALALFFAAPAVGVKLADSWTWAGGSNATKQAGVYGEMGVVSALNTPGGRKHAVSWVDASRNRAYIFGGQGYGASASGTAHELNDLWWFDLVNAAAGKGWTWAGGSNATNQAGVYGEVGVASALNMPGARFSAVSWIDTRRNRAYIFGGRGYGASASGFSQCLNDLWWFDLEAGEGWTWAGGSNATNQVGVYGEVGVESALNTPGARYNAVSWVDASRKRAYIFGGQGYGASASGTAHELNDLWWYDLDAAPGEGWTWAGGSNATEEAGVYGEMGVVSALNMPGARWKAVSWVDTRRNRAYIFSGTGYGVTGLSGQLNDLWWYDLDAAPGEGWTWAGGSNATNQVGEYGEMGVASALNTPGARHGAVSWVDTRTNRAYIFGGDGYGAAAVTFGGLNDLWYRPAGAFGWSLDFALEVTGKLGNLSSSELTDKKIAADVR
jgi:hypothetical protein